MSHLPRPLDRVLASSADDVAIERIWRGMQGRRAERRRARRARWAAAIAAAAVVVLVVSWRAAGPRLAGDVGPLRVAGGGDLGALVAPLGAPQVYVFSEGSRLELDPGARLEPLENGPTAFSVLLASGRATFDVHPGGPRRWTVECGIATVEVVGTRFTVERSGTHARVSVERGVVLVRGERVPDRVQKLTVGQSLDVEDLPSVGGAPQPSVRDESVTPPLPPPAPSSPTAAAPPASTARTPSDSWRVLAQRGDNDHAYAELGPTGIRSAARDASVDDLLALADVARLSGHPADAVAPLSRVLAEHAGDSRASIAAFTLGRLELDALAHPAAAADAFARAIALGLPASLEEDAYARLVEARARAGDAAGARDAAREYERRFPAGKRLAEVRRWVPSE